MSGSEEVASAAPTVAPAGRGRLLPMILLGVACLGLGAGGAWLAAQRIGSAAAAGAADDGAEAGGAPLAERVLNLDPFVVNVAGESFQRFLKTRVEIEAASPHDREALAERTAQLRDA